jgi:transposase
MIEKSKYMRGQIQMTCLENLVPADHLLRKIDKAIDFNRIYGMVEYLYCEDNGRPAADPVVLVKMVFIQHLFGIRSLRQTVKEIDMNIAYRWFLGYGIDTPLPHFATISYAFATRFPSEVFEGIFAWILEEAMKRGFVNPATLFIDATHLKASANKNKRHKEQIKRAARTYDRQLREDINADREAHGKKPFKDKDDDEGGGTKETVASDTDPDCGLFRKGEHKVEFAYTAHVACDENNFILACETTPGNVHDSVVFDAVYDKAAEILPNSDAVAVDAGYKTPWICKKVTDAGKKICAPYKRPMGKEGFFRPHEYVYDEYYDCVLCPADKALPYRTTNRKGYREYKSDPAVCSGCPMRPRCTESKSCQKTVMRHIWAEYLEIAEDIRHSPGGKARYAMRGKTVERVFADAKEKHGMRHTMLRGLRRVSDWVRMKFAAMNLKKLAMWAW